MNRPQVGIGVLIFNGDQILLGKRLTKHGSNMWSPPGGHLEFGETFSECAIREVQEEAGIVIHDPQMAGVTNDVFEETGKHYVTIFMRAEYDGKQAIQNLEPEKLLAWEWFALSKLPEHLFLPLQNFLRVNKDCMV